MKESRGALTEPVGNVTSVKKRKKAKQKRIRKAAAPADACCQGLKTAVDDPSIPVVFVPKFREFGILVLDGRKASRAHTRDGSDTIERQVPGAALRRASHS